MWLRELFGETGDISMMRVLCFLSFLTAAILAFMGKDTSVLVFVGAAFGGKVAQKHIEVNGAKTDTEIKDEK
jgi:hypothetical protein